jgi:MFS family permease
MRRGYLLILLSTLSAFNFLDQQLMSILLEPVRHEFDLTDIELGLLSGLAFAALYTVLSVPAGIWAVRHSRRNLIAAASLLWGAMTIACGFAQSFTQLVLARLGVGIGEARGLPPSQAWVSDVYKPGERATALAALAAGVNAGIFLAFLVGGYVGHRYGWRIAFLVAGLPPLLLAVLLRLTTLETTMPKPLAAAAGARAAAALVGTTIARMWSDQLPGNWGGLAMGSCNSIPSSNTTFFPATADGGHFTAKLSTSVYGACKKEVKARYRAPTAADGSVNVIVK